MAVSMVLMYTVGVTSICETVRLHTLDNHNKSGEIDVDISVEQPLLNEDEIKKR